MYIGYGLPNFARIAPMERALISASFSLLSRRKGEKLTSYHGGMARKRVSDNVSLARRRYQW